MACLKWILSCVALSAILSLTGLTRANAAQESWLSRDNGVADKYEALQQDFHYVWFVQPADWAEAYADEVQFFGQRFGNIAGRKGTVVFWKQEKPVKVKSRQQQLNGALVVLHTQQFDLDTVPETPGWFTIKLDPVKLPSAFAVSVYTHSDDTNGVRLGLTKASTAKSFSSATHPGKDGEWTGLKPFRDGRNWLLRVKVRDTLAPVVALDPAELTGSSFAAFDDGTAEGFVTLRKRGLLLRCDTAAPRKVQSVYIHGKLAGDWFGSTRKLTVMVLDRDLKLLSRIQVPYTQFTNEAAWNEVKFSPVAVGTMHYICVEPSSTAAEQFLVGYDNSGQNHSSSHGSTGTMLAWPFTETAEDKTNWMIRVKYAP